ncbi:hypothetical protein [Sporanaerobacter sp. PP17-6a]|uniref:hypothetical protein n=1 Tax=Sporanaerobacter sp. PP17-6a TaxID=1891289 RepID=UPI001356706F|nr:hypothetical protein [Sporanaerobacter sp. PP17-6a]
MVKKFDVKRLKIFKGSDYGVSKVKIIDMFPRNGVCGDGRFDIKGLKSNSRKNA